VAAARLTARLAGLPDPTITPPRVIPQVPLHDRVAPVPDMELRMSPRTALNRICDISDWRAGALQDAMMELGIGSTISRKGWEQAECVAGFRRLNVIRADADILSVGAGVEPSLYVLARYVRSVVATDLYGPEWGLTGTDDLSEMLRRYQPFDAPLDRMRALRMSGLDLGFPDNSFDGVYTLSSIEHFGGHAAAHKAVLEIARVLRPGGVACVVTELLLSRHSAVERFTREELQEYVIDGVGMELIEPEIDMRISESLLAHPVNLHYEQDLTPSPHIVMIDAHGNMWTSVTLFFRKHA
jgi:SAM-dependent methyltransferase